MAEKKMGNQTVKFETCPYVIGSAAVVGQKEGERPLCSWFDVILDDDMFGENGDRTLSFLPSVTIGEEEAFQTAMDFFERYDLTGAYPVKKAHQAFYNERYTYYEVYIEIHIPRPEHIINKYAIRKNVYRFYINDSGVLYVSFQ